MAPTLLVLDDDELVGAFVCRVAQDLGFEARATSNVSDFKAALAERAADEIVLDLRLGKTDGIEVLRWLAAQDCRARITLFSGFDDRVLASARQLGSELGLRIGKALTKPIRFDALAQALDPAQAQALTFSAEDLRSGIANGELHLEYQPIIACATGVAESVEALARWRRREGLTVPPDLFIPMAEADPGLMDAMTLEVARQAGAAARVLRASGFDLRVAINVSARNLHRLDFPDRLAEVFETEGALPAQIGLEITETGAMQDPLVSQDVLLRIRLKGFALAVDDFGTGHTSIAMFRRLPYGELKIDRSFVAAMLDDAQSRAVVAAAVSLADSMGLATVAEGVETPAVLAALRVLGATAAQGYLFSRPLSLEALLPWLRERAALGLVARPASQSG